MVWGLLRRMDSSRWVQLNGWVGTVFTHLTRLILKESLAQLQQALAQFGCREYVTSAAQGSSWRGTQNSGE